MSPKNQYPVLSAIAALLFLLTPTAGMAQYGVATNLLMPPNPSPYLSDWMDGSQDIQLIINNTSSQTYTVQIAFTLSLDGAEMISNDLNTTEVQFIEPGTHSFLFPEIVPHVDMLQFSGEVEESFFQTGKLPAGVYQACAQLFEIEHQEWITQPDCQMVTITSYQPPEIIFPPQDHDFLSNQPVYFQYSAVAPSVPPSSSMYPVSYHLVVMEVMEDQSPTEAFMSNIPVFESFVENQTQVFWTPDFDPPVPGTQYVWNIRALDAMENPVGPGDGWYEPHTFLVIEPDTEEPEDAFYDLVFQIITPEGEIIEDAVVSLNGELSPPGHFHFQNLTPGHYDYEVLAEMFVPATGAVDLAQEDLTLEITLTPEDTPEDPEPSLFTLTFQVTNPQGIPLPQAQITLDGELNEPGITEFEDLESGTYSWEVTAANHQPLEGSTTLNMADATQEVVLKPEETDPFPDPDEELFSLEFNITNMEGEQIPDAVVSLQGEAAGPGVFLFDSLPPGHYSYEVTAPMYYPASGEVTLSDGNLIADVNLEADECPCDPCAIVGLSVAFNQQTLTVHRQAPLYVGEAYQFTPIFRSPCPDDCPKASQATLHFEIRGYNDQTLQEATLEGSPTVHFKPQHSGEITVRATGTKQCDDNICQCSSLQATFPVIHRTIAEPADPGVTRPDDETETPEREEDRPTDTEDPGIPHRPLDERDPPHEDPPYDPPYDPPDEPPFDTPEDDTCLPGYRTEPGPGIVLNIDLEENNKFPYPRAVPLHAHAIDWDLVFFNCEDCEGLIREMQFPVMDNVSDYTWELIGKGSLNEPFRADNIMELEHNTTHLEEQLELLQSKLDELTHEISKLPEELEQRQQQAESKKENLSRQMDNLKDKKDSIADLKADAREQMKSIREEKATLREKVTELQDSIVELTTVSDSLKVLLKNKPGEEELEIMQQVEQLFSQREDLKETLEDKEREIIDQKKDLQQQIGNAREALKAVSEEYTQVRKQIPAIQEAINQVYEQMYTTETVTHVIEQKNPWIEAADEMLDFLLEDVQLSTDTLETMYFARNEVERWVPGFFFTTDTTQLKNIVDTVLYFVETFQVHGQLHCDSLEEGELKSLCHNKLYWMEEIETPFVQSISEVIHQEVEVLSPEHVQRLDSLKTVLNNLNFQLTSRSQEVEQKNSDLQDAMQQFTQTMTALEDEKKNIEESLSSLQEQIVEKQNSLAELKKAREDDFLENQESWEAGIFEADSLSNALSMGVKQKEAMLVGLLSDSADLDTHISFLQEDIHELEKKLDESEKIMEALATILEMDIDQLLSDKKAQKEDLKNQISLLEKELESLKREMEELTAGAQKSAEGPMVYYIPPPLEEIMQDKEHFEELKEKVDSTRQEYDKAVAFKASLQKRFTTLLENLSGDLKKAGQADQQIEALQEREDELSEAFNQMHEEKEQEHEEALQDLEHQIAQAEEDLTQADEEESSFSEKLQLARQQREQKKSSYEQKQAALAEEQQQLQQTRSSMDSLERIVSNLALQLRELANESSSLAAETEKLNSQREQANDQLSNAVITNNQELENTLNQQIESINSQISQLKTQHQALQNQRKELEQEHVHQVNLLESYRELQHQQAEQTADAQSQAEEARAQYNEARREQQAVFNHLMELQRKRGRLEARISTLQGQLEEMPSLSGLISADNQLQDANQAMRSARQERMNMEDLLDRSKNNIEKYLKERDSLKEVSTERLQEAITARDNALEDLREFLLQEFENTTFADTLRVTARDEVIDGWRSRDDQVEKEVIIEYSGGRIPELLAEEDDVVVPPQVTEGPGDCEITIDLDKLSDVVPQTSQVRGPEPRTIALLYKNGEPLWPEWPVLPTSAGLLAKSALMVQAGGSDRDLITQLCNIQSEDCNDPPPPDHVFEDVLDFSWSGDGNFFNDQVYSDFVLWEPLRVEKPECNEEQEIETIHRANTVVGDDPAESVSLISIEPGIMIEVTDSVMGYPDHTREVVARIVKGNYQGLPGEKILFEAELTEGASEDWGFGSDSSEVIIETDALGYARTDFDFGNGFAKFDITATWIREEESDECQQTQFVAEAPLYLKMHYLGFSMDEQIRKSSAIVWEGASIDQVLDQMEEIEKEEKKPDNLLAVAGLLDHNRDFVVGEQSNESENGGSVGKVLFEVDAAEGDEGKMEPAEAFTSLFGIADSYVVPTPGEDTEIVVTAEVEEVFYPLGRPPIDSKNFDTRRENFFRIGRDDDLFIVQMDESFSPHQPLSGTGSLISTAAPGQLMLEAIGNLGLRVEDVTLEQVDGEWVAIDGKVSWQAETSLSIDMWGFSFGLDSVAIYPVQGAGIGGTINHDALSYPVGYYAELFTNGDFWGEVSNLPEIAVGEMKLHKGSHLVIDWRQDHSIAGLEDSFRGIVIRKATLDLPPVFRSSGDNEPSQLQAKDFAIGTGGLHGSLSVSENPLQLGYAGFDFTLASMSVKLENTAIQDFDMEGAFSFPDPVSGSVTAQVNMVGDSGWSVELETDNTLRIPKFNTYLDLHTGTGIDWDSETETGTASINASISSDYFSEVTVTGLEVNTNGVFKAESIELGLGIEIGGGFSFHINTISFNIGQEDDHIMLEGGLGLEMIAASQLEGGLKVMSGPDIAFEFHKARIEFERKPFSFEGELAYDGDQFRGEFDIDIQNLFGLEALLIFGNMPLNEEEVYNYWYAQLVMKGAIPLGQVVLMELGGGLGYNYIPPVGSTDGSPDYNEAFSFKAIIGMGTAGAPPGKIARGRMEMTYIPGLFSLYGKLWLLERENSLFGEGQLNLHWEPEVMVDGKVRTYIGLADAEGKIFRFNGQISYHFHDQGYHVKSEDISGRLFEEFRGEMAMDINDEHVVVDGRVFYDAEGEFDILVAILRGHISIDATAGFSYTHATNQLVAQTNLDAFASIDLINNFWNYHANILRSEILMDCSIDANPQRVIVQAKAEVSYDVWFVSGSREVDFGFEI